MVPLWPGVESLDPISEPRRPRDDHIRDEEPGHGHHEDNRVDENDGAGKNQAFGHD